MLKNSHKVLLGGGGIILLLLFIFLVSAKRQLLVDYDDQERSISANSSDDYKDWNKTFSEQLNFVNRIVIEGKISTDINQGKSNLLEVWDENGGNLNYDIEGETLTLTTKRKMHGKRVHCTIAIQELQSLECEGAVDIELHNIETEDLEISLEGAYNIEAINSSVKNLRFKCEGVGSVNFDDMTVKYLMLKTEGVSSMDFYVENGRVSGKIKGLGSININGSNIENDLERNGIIAFSVDN